MSATKLAEALKHAEQGILQVTTSIGQHIAQGVASEALVAAQRPGYGTGIYTYLKHRTEDLRAVALSAREALAAFEASGPDTAEAPAWTENPQLVELKMLRSRVRNQRDELALLKRMDVHNIERFGRMYEVYHDEAINAIDLSLEEAQALASELTETGGTVEVFEVLRRNHSWSNKDGYGESVKQKAARAALATPPLQTPAAPMTLNEFCSEADRIGLTADVFAAQLAERPEFADCVKAPSKVFESHALEQASKSAQVTMKPYRDAREATYREDLKHATLLPVSPLQEQDKRDEDEQWAIDRAADLLEGYVEFIRNHVMSVDIEMHPYVPEIEDVAEQLRALPTTQDKRDGAPTADEITSLLPCSYYMDPPDGGDVTLLEQLQRMAKDAERYRFIRDTPWSPALEDVIRFHRNARWDVEVDAAILAKSQGAGTKALPDMEAGGKTP